MIKLENEPSQTEVLKTINGKSQEFIENTKNPNGGYPILSWQSN